MGDMAEMYDYLIEQEDEFDPKGYFDLGPEWLVENSANARKPVVVSIRKQWKEAGRISTKQQWVLAFWCAQYNYEHT